MSSPSGPVVGLATLVHVPEGYESAVELLEEVLGFARVRDWDGDESRGVILRVADGAEIEVVGPPRGATWSRASSDVQLSVLVRDVDRWWRELVDDPRVRVVDALSEQSFGVRSFGLAMTDDVSVYIVERLAGNPARRDVTAT